MLHPGDAEEDADPVFQTEVEEPAGRGRVDADQIGAGCANGREILGDLLLRAELVPFGIRREGGVGHSLDEKFLLPLEEELGSHDNSFSHLQTFLK